MKIFANSLFHSKATALLFAFVLLVCAARVAAQTTFSLTSTAANYATGAFDPNASGAVSGSGIASSGSSFSSTGTTLNNITPLTFGQSFTAAVNGTSTQAGTAAWLYDGTLGGSSIANGTVLPIAYNFTIGKNAGITSDATWSLYFDGDRHGPSATTQIASGTLSGASATFSSIVNYSYTSGASSGDLFRAYLEVASTSNNVALGQGIITVTMSNTGFGGEGITLNAIPEPSTYAAIAGVAMLGFAVWRRQSRKNSPAVAQPGATG
ncbi:MAG: PEP-CTERM sorting domain-containing protein [Verrucomicrobia bacterium]|nr:PEP-CTERM sorting domain-containing protein [Verrucomicrobiota bacterium]